MRRLSDAGVPCGVFLAPILPGITDAVASIEAVAAAAKAHGAASFGSAVLRLAPQVKEHYLAFVSETFPDLLPRYERAYAGTNISSDYQAALERRLARIRERHRYVEDAMDGRWDEANRLMQIAAPVVMGSRQLALSL
jgi:DNA repair photolyase